MRSTLGRTVPGIYVVATASLFMACIDSGAPAIGSSGPTVEAGAEAGARVSRSPNAPKGVGELALPSVRQRLLEEGFTSNRPPPGELHQRVEIMVAGSTGQKAFLPTDSEAGLPVLVWKNNVVVQQLLSTEPSYLGMEVRPHGSPIPHRGAPGIEADEGDSEGCCVGMCFGEYLPYYWSDPADLLNLCISYCAYWGPEIAPECYSCQPCSGQSCGVDASCGTGESCGTCAENYACNGSSCVSEGCASGNLCDNTCCPGSTDSCINNSCCSSANVCDGTCCVSGQTCVTPTSGPPQCCDAGSACGTSECCDSLSSCIGGACCPNNNVCGTQCLSGGQTCVGGTVCSADQSCGDSCCTTSQTCVDGACSNCAASEQQCGDTCCPSDSTICTDGYVCCPYDQYCAGACCSSDQFCSDYGVCTDSY
jgi:hypothetical protein